MKEIGQERIIFILCLFVLGYGLICIQPYLLPQIVNKDSTISYVNFSLFLIKNFKMKLATHPIC